MRLLVCGGRDYYDAERAFAALDRAHERRRITAVIHGGATGADGLADLWAAARGIRRRPYPVTRQEWNELGPKAGPMRNQRMLAESDPEAVLALPGGRGTRDMVRRAEAAGLRVWKPYGLEHTGPQLTPLQRFRKVAAVALEALEWAHGGEPLPTLEAEAIVMLKTYLSSIDP